MKNISMVLLMLFASTIFAAEKVNILKWPRLPANKLGCILEKSFNYKDKKFNCSLVKYQNKGDPCKNTKAYYEGPTLPKSSAKKVHPKAEAIDLGWEHGELQKLSVEFKNGVTESEIRDYFKLPNKFNYPENHKNIMSIDISSCSSASLCLTIQGFDHVGTGDVDCK